MNINTIYRQNTPLLLTYIALLIIIIALIYTVHVLLKPDFEIEHTGIIVDILKTDDGTIITFHDDFVMELKHDPGNILNQYRTVKQGRSKMDYYEIVFHPNIVSYAEIMDG
jgi:hypothetical protein